ncbi:major facilitator superfamily domain-containing protein [Aspergillus ambiguus]|uniref:putative MFS multidrug transporter n=1 Tax=Aspergillus ambiguus TaxID=176160 RepID=UPI003CCDCD52
MLQETPEKFESFADNTPRMNPALQESRIDTTEQQPYALDSDTIERLGRERPSCFGNAWSEYAFCFSIFMCQILAEYYISGSNVLLPTLVEELDIPPALSIWPSTALSLVVTSTLLIFGRLSDMFGGFVLYVGGMTWLMISSIIAGFSQSWIMLFVLRALQGLALASYLPSSIMILGKVYRPGPRKNLVFSIYGACAALGFFVGIFFSGLSGSLLSWRWYFFIGAILSAITAVSSYFSIPSDFAETKGSSKVQMDWIGCGLLIPGTVLFVFSLADSAHAPKQWETPYIYVCLILGVILLAAFTYMEGWVVNNPLLPLDLFSVKYMKPLANIWKAWSESWELRPFKWWPTGGFILHVLNGTVLMIISCLGYLLSGLLFALLPLGGNYWAFVFPAMIGGTIGIDVSFNVTNIFITTNMPKDRQGLAGALINCTLHMGIAVMLAFADIIQVGTEDKGLKASYQMAFWFQVALAGFALLLVLLFVRIDRAKSELTVDERRQLEHSQ